MNKKTIFIAAAIIATIAFVVFWQSQNWRDWNVYENSRYSFSVEYPSSWQLGETETNAAGREMVSPEGEAICYAYGFANALLNDQGEPQTLDEFIDWLTTGTGSEIKVLEREETFLSGQKGIYLRTEQRGGITEANYILNNEEGRGLYCFYEDKSTYQSLGTVFDSMTESFRD